MNPTAPATPLLLTAEGFTARADLIALAEAKAAKLLRHRVPAVSRVRVHVKLETPHEGPPLFAACATADTAGPDFIAHGSGDEPEAAVHAVFDRLERAIADAAGLRKHKRHAAAADPTLSAALG